MVKRSLFILILVAVGLLFAAESFAAGLQIKGDYFYMNGRPFYIRGVGYSPWRPGQQPGADLVDIKLIEYDLKMMKDAGFNTIRTWDAFDEGVLALAQEYGLFVIQGIWIDPNRDFSDKYWQDAQIRRIERVIKYSRKYPNVLMYIVMTEPSTKAVLYAGKEKTEEFFRRIVEAVHKIDERPVSMDSWIPMGFLDHSMWDAVTFNAFMFTPESINKVLGFEDYVRFIKKNYAKDKPLLIGETGGFSVSSKREGALGYGGNTEEEQSRGDINSILSSFKAGAAGVCIVSWIDTWHYPGNPDLHDDDPWEWSGIIAMEEKDDPYGRPRMVYNKLKEFNSEYDPKAEELLQTAGDTELIITPAKEVFSPSDKIEIDMKVLRGGKPLAGKVIDYGFFIQEGWKDYKASIITGSNGGAVVACNLPVDSHTGYIIFCASFKDNISKVSDMRFLEVQYKR